MKWYAICFLIGVIGSRIEASPVLCPSNGHYYEAVNAQGISWSDALSAASSVAYHGVSGHLATVTSAQENSFVGPLATAAGPREYWLGGYQNPITESIPTAGWTWINGEGTFPGTASISPFAVWQPAEPRDYYGTASEQYLAIGSSQWNDEGNLNYISGYIVEYDTQPSPVTISVLCADSGGTASASPTSGLPGSTITLTATPLSGYSFSLWSLNDAGGGSISSTITNLTTFTFGSSNATITANFTPIPTITVLSSSGGSATAAAASGPLGSTTDLTATCDPGFVFSTWLVVKKGGGAVVSPLQANTLFAFGYDNAIVKACFVSAPIPANDPKRRIGLFNNQTGQFESLPVNYTPSKHVYVMIHGWAPNFAASVAESKAGGIAMPLAWNVTSLGGDFISPWNKLANIISAADPSGDVLFFSWVDLSASPFPFAGISRGSADQMGRLLAHTLNDIGINQAFVAGGGNIQLIGHSHGAEVGTIATATLQAQSAHVDLLMMLDSPENSAATALGGANRTDFPMKQINIGSGPGETLVVDYIGNESEITAYGRPSSDPRVINLTAYGSSHGSILDVYGADISAFGTASSHWLVASGRLSASQEQYQRLFQALTMQTEGSVTVDSGVTTVSEHSPSSWTTTVTTHSWDQTLTFDYQFLNAGDGDQLSVLVDGDSRFLCQGNIVGTNAFGATVDVADLAPGDHVVTFLLNSYGIPNASFILSNFALWSIPAEVRLTDVRNVAGSIVQFSFTCIPGTNFNVLSTTNLTVQLTNWVILGNATEVFPGYYQFADTKATNCSQRFYRVRLP